MSDENKDILEQVTELISSKKETLKESSNENKSDSENFDQQKLENQSDVMKQSSVDLFIKKEVKNWIENNAEKLAKDIINEQAKKIFK